MPLDPRKESVIRSEAERRGLDPEEAIRRANAAVSGSAPASEGASSASTGKPTAERLLIGFLPFVTVKELRSIWLGLDAPFIDDGLSCAEWQVKHGAIGASASDAPPEGQ